VVLKEIGLQRHLKTRYLLLEFPVAWKEFENYLKEIEFY
jgi:hypothetical protein